MYDFTTDKFLCDNPGYVLHYVRVVRANEAFFNDLFDFLNRNRRLMTSPDARVHHPKRGGLPAFCPMLALLPALEGEPWYVSFLQATFDSGPRGLRLVRFLHRAVGAAVKFCMVKMGRAAKLRPTGRGHKSAARGGLPGAFDWSVKSGAVFED